MHRSGDGRRKAHVLCAMLHLGRGRGYLACPNRTSKINNLSKRVRKGTEAITSRRGSDETNR